jgi:hypothetical protein
MHSAREGIVVGVIMATLYSAFVVVVYAVNGSRPFVEHGVTLPGVIAAYYAGGVFAGALLGTLWPRVRSRLEAMLVGILGAFVVVMAAGVAMYGYPSSWNDASWISILFTALAFGILGANMFWSGQRQR